MGYTEDVPFPRRSWKMNTGYVGRISDARVQMSKCVEDNERFFQDPVRNHTVLFFL